MKFLPILFAILGGYVTASTTWAGGIDHRVLVIHEKTPEVDGTISGEEWSEALPLDRMPQPEGFPQTEAWILLGPSHLYVAVRSQEPNPSRIKTTTLADEIKGMVWMDDSVEVSIDAGNTGRSLFQVIANTEGTIYDGMYVDGQAIPTAWDSAARVRTRIGKQAWELEMAIPLETLYQWSRGDLLALNVARVRYAGGKREVTSYAGKRFLETERFLRFLIGGSVDAGKSSVIVSRRGPFRRGEDGEWIFSKLKGDWKELKLEAGLPKKQGQRIPLQPEREGDTRIRIAFPADDAEAFSELELYADGQRVYRSSHEVRKAERAQRFTNVEEPLFDELVEARPEGLSREGIFQWTQELTRPLMKVVPYRAAMPYRHGVTPFENYRRDRSILIVSPDFFGKFPERVATAEKYGLQWLVYPHYYAALKQGVPSFDPKGRPSEKHIWILDPRAKKAYLDQSRRAVELAARHPGAKWFFAGDESWERLHRALLLALDRKEDYPELAAADREIREKYGFGKYGLPHSSTDENPFRWIATYRWEIDQMMSVAHEIRAMIREHAPQMRLVSWDSMTGHRPYGIDRWGEVFDIATAQIYPAFGRNRDHIGFTTQFYADLSNVDEIWPVPHFEHFPNNFSAEETTLILSAMLRGGATGMHLWTGDHINEGVRRRGTSIVDRIGAPERWNVVRSLIDRLREPFRVRRPEADTAIFYSNPSFQATGAPPTFHQYNHCEWIYTVLGPQLGGAIRLIDEAKAARDPEGLKRYRIIYLPYIPIADDAEYQALEAYVRNGGTLVVCDPRAFRHRSNGTERTAAPLQPDVEPREERVHAPIWQMHGAEKVRTLRPLGSFHRFRNADGQVLLRDAAGAPLAVEQPLEKGKVIFMAQNPAVQSLIKDSGWLEFFRSLQLSAGAKLGHPVWRFKLPEPPPLQPQRPSGVCLTGNYFEWSYSKPKPVANSPVGGSYRIDGPVNLHGREPKEQEIPFATGRLMDRIRGANAPNEARRSEFTLLCQSREPWTLRLRHHRPVIAKQARLIFGGELPPGHCEVSTDGQEWREAGAWEGRSEAVDDVGLVEVALEAGEPARYLRFHFNASAKRSLELAEVEVWGDPAHQ